MTVNRNNRLIRGILAAMMFALSLSMYSQKQFDYENITYQVKNDTYCKIARYVKDEWKGNCKLPSTVYDETGKSYVVNEVANMAFSACKGVDYVILPETIVSIGSSAFSQSEFKWIVMFDKVRTLGEYCFYNASKLQYIRLSKNIQELPDYAFCGLSSMRCLRLPDYAKASYRTLPGKESGGGLDSHLNVLVMGREGIYPSMGWRLNLDAVYSLYTESYSFASREGKFEGTIFCPIGCMDKYIHEPESYGYPSVTEVYEFDMSRLKDVLYPYWADLGVPEEYLEF